MKHFRKKELVILAALLFVILMIGSVVFAVYRYYQGLGTFFLEEWQGEYDYNGKMMIGPDGSAKQFDSLGASGFRDVSLQSLDLSPFGFEGKIYEYYPMSYRVQYGSELSPREEVLWLGKGEEYEGFWPVSNPEHFVYIGEDGAKYRIHPKEDLSYPIFSDSIDGVDIYGRNVVAFSAGGSYAIGIENDTVYIYHTDPMDDSLRIVDVKTVSFSSYSSFSFGAFVSDSGAYFSVTENGGEAFLIALDCKSGQTAKSRLDADKKHSSSIGRLYVQELIESDRQGKQEVVWCQRLLGTRFSSPMPEGFTDVTLFSVSPEGNYAVGTATGENGEETLIFSQKRAFSLSSVQKEGEEILSVFFVYENVIAVNTMTPDGNITCRSYRICF